MPDLVLVERTPAERLAFAEGRLSLALEVLRRAAMTNGITGMAQCVWCDATAREGAEVVHRPAHPAVGILREYAGCPAVRWVELAQAMVDEARRATLNDHEG